MMGNSWLLVMILLSSLFTGLIIFFLGEERHTARTILNMLGATLKLVLVVFLGQLLIAGHSVEARLLILPGIELLLWADALSMVFVILSSVLWMLTTLFAVGYLEESPNRSRFFGFFSLCVSATMGIAMAGNLFTFLIFYELLTLSTYPLVIHRGTEEALRGGRTYLIYTLSGGAVLLVATAWLYVLAGPVTFTVGGALWHIAADNANLLRFLFFLFIAGLGVKAAMFPLHAWLPVAMVAPAPVSALLHAVAVVKAGAFGIVRIVHDVFGAQLATDLGVMQYLLIAAAVTVIYGSLRALTQDDLKKRLAFSTVSQVSYIIMGISIFGPWGMVGGVVHLIHQGIMKITLFFCAGNFAETLGIHKVSEMDGVGKRMPWTMAAFTIGALGMIGLPPMAGFITKWYLGVGAIDGGAGWVVVVLMASTLLNSAYFLPIIYRGWFKTQHQPWHIDHQFGRWETDWMLLTPPVITAVFTLAAGILANLQISPLQLVQIIAQLEYLPGG
jgi:multicomponent Na+:H+ antiporter subunit D